MISKFTVGNFLSFKDKQTLSFTAKKQDSNLKDALLNIDGETLIKTIAVYGANASGKSNLTKAFVFVRNFVLNGLNQLEDSIPVRPYLLNSETARKPSFFEIEFFSDKTRFKYGFKVSREKVYAEWLYQYPNKKILFERKLGKIKVNPRHFKEGSAKTREQTIARKNVLFLSVVASYGGVVSTKVVSEIKKIQIISGLERGQTLDYSFDKFTTDENYRKKIKDFMFEADLGIYDILPEEKRITIKDIPPQVISPQFRERLATGKDFFERNLAIFHQRFNSKGQKSGIVPFDFFRESDGTRQMFALSAPFINTLEKSKILIIDELDSSLHPLMCRFILKIFNSSEQNPNHAQLVFTTHDTSLLDEKLIRRDQIWFTQKDKYGASILFSLADLKERANMNFAKRYLEGRYGALPYIKKLEDID